MNVKFTFKNDKIPSFNRLIELDKINKKTQKSRKTHKVVTKTALDILKQTLNRELGNEALHQHRGGVIDQKHAVIFKHFVKDVDLTDPDNIEVRQKFIFDALVNCDILVDDTYSILGGGKIHLIKRDKSRPRIEVYFIKTDFSEIINNIIKKHF